MFLPMDAPTFRDVLAGPSAAETFSAVAECPLAVVQVSSAAKGRLLADLDITALPCVVVVVTEDSRWLPAGAAGAADVLLTRHCRAGRGSPVRQAGRGSAGRDRYDHCGRHAEPGCRVFLALLLRASAGLDVPAGLVAESATYSALQEGVEFRRWRASRPARPAEQGTGRVHTEHAADGTVRITLARPSRRNAVDWRMRDALAGALAQAAASPQKPIMLAKSACMASSIPIASVSPSSAATW